uniref:MerR family transcriptional regulator n=1 Tax=Desulfobacca acetoxidans TaxID=60893 RepID=A0A7V4G855_9BACT
MKIFCKKAVIALTGVSYKQLDHWAVTGLIRPSVKAAKGKGSRREYSFRDLVQIRVAKGLRDEGISLQKIRSALIFLRKHFPDTEAPLAQLKFVTNGSDIFVLERDPQKVLDALRGQFVFSLALGELIDELRGEVRQLASPKEERFVVGGKAFVVTLAVDKEQGGNYIATCKEVPTAVGHGETEQDAVDHILEMLRLSPGAEKSRKRRA